MLICCEMFYTWEQFTNENNKASVVPKIGRKKQEHILKKSFTQWDIKRTETMDNLKPLLVASDPYVTGGEPSHRLNRHIYPLQNELFLPALLFLSLDLIILMWELMNACTLP